MTITDTEKITSAQEYLDALVKLRLGELGWINLPAGVTLEQLDGLESFLEKYRSVVIPNPSAPESVTE